MQEAKKLGASIFKNSVFMVGAEAVARLLRFLLIIFIARKLGVTDFGKFSFALAFGGIFILFSDLGVSSYTVKQLARRKELSSEYFSRAIIAKVILSIFTIIIISSIFLTNKDLNTKLTVEIISLSMIFNSLAVGVKSIFQAHEKLIYEAISNILLGLMIVLFGVYVISIYPSVVLLAVVYLFSSIVEFIFCLIIYFKKFGHFKFNLSFPLFHQLIKESLPFGLQAMFATFYYLLDSNMLSFMKGDWYVGIYNAAYRLIGITTLLALAFNKAVYPVISRLFQSSISDFREVLITVFKISVFSGVVSTIFLYLLSGPLIVLIFGQGYAESANVLSILAFACGLLFINNFLGPTIRAIDGQKYSAKIVVSAFFFNLVTNMLLIPKYSFYGAAATTVLTELGVTIFYLRYITQKVHGVKKIFMQDIGKVLLALIVAIAANFYFLPDNILWRVIFILGVAFTLIFIAKLPSVSDMRKFVFKNV